MACKMTRKDTFAHFFSDMVSVIELNLVTGEKCFIYIDPNKISYKNEKTYCDLTVGSIFISVLNRLAPGHVMGEIG